MRRFRRAESLKLSNRARDEAEIARNGWIRRRRSAWAVNASRSARERLASEGNGTEIVSGETDPVRALVLEQYARGERIFVRGAEVEERSLAGAEFEGRELPEVTFGSLDMEEVVFRKAGLRKAVFSRVGLTRADFQGADLRSARFRNADLRDADFVGARLEGASFVASILDGATWPDGRRCAEGPIGECR